FDINISGPRWARRTDMKENPVRSLPGIPVLLVLFAALLVAAWWVFSGDGGPSRVFAALGVGVASLFCMVGLYMVEPNQAAVLSLFGKYVGTVKDNGLRWNNPFYSKKKLSLRVRNFESGKQKVKEQDGTAWQIASAHVRLM